MTRRKSFEDRMQAYKEAQRQLSEQLADIDFIWQGSIQRRMLSCGKSGCACQSDRQARHGPYAYWTRKENQKTVSKLLTAEEADLYEEWIENRRHLEGIVRDMQKLSRRAGKTALVLRARAKRNKKADT